MIKSGYVETKSNNFRPNTALKKQKIAFRFDVGGLGDFIHWTSAIQYAVESTDYIFGLIVTPTYFADLARLWFKKYEPRFKVIERNSHKINDVELKGYLVKSPSHFDNIDSMGHALLPLGFSYYLNMDYVPQGWNKLPEITGNEVDISKFNLPKRYAIICTAATAKVRQLPSKTINDIIDHCVKIGVTPVFLGKEKLNHDYKSNSASDINYYLGIDLRESTSLLETSCIIAKGLFICGLDGGLLHIGMCSDVPVIISFTTVDPRHRLAPRQGNTYVIEPPKELGCRFCQSRMRFVGQHDFRKCLYDDYLCLDLITSDSFITAINSIMEIK